MAEAEDEKKKLPDETETFFAEIEDYQNRMVTDWESAKDSYKKKIDEIMTDFAKQGAFPADDFSSPPTPGEPPPLSPPRPAAAAPDAKIDRLMAGAEAALREAHDRTQGVFPGPE